MQDTLGLKIREIFHFRYGICQLVYFAGANCWIGLNEKKQTLWAPDEKGGPQMERIRKPHYIYSEQIAYLEILNPHYVPDCMVLDLRKREENSPAWTSRRLQCAKHVKYRSADVIMRCISARLNDWVAMPTDSSEHDDTFTRLNQETAKIQWQDLQPHFARGAIIYVAPQLDLVQVACDFSHNNSERVSRWLEAGQVQKATDDHAVKWTQNNTEFWAVVVAPWVLAQPIVPQQTH